MDPAASFGDANSGSQIGFNYGSITNHFGPSLNFEEKLPIVPGAMFNSYIDQHEYRCLPGTRSEILFQIENWASCPSGRCIFWLNGMAGTGKSTISRTMAALFNQTGCLGASFFFKRGEAGRGNALKFFPTIAKQLATSVPQLLRYIHQAIQIDAGIAEKAMTEQFEQLIIQPLLKLEQHEIMNRAFIIVVDALDECEGNDDIRLILRLLPQLQKASSNYVKVLLTSRPELPIRLGFSRIANTDYQALALHEIPATLIERDIKLFLNHRLSEIRKERRMPPCWPGGTDFQNLVKLSVPLFVFASTICRVLEDPHWDPVDSLTEILAYRNNGTQLDGTYLPILNRLLQRQSEKQKKQLVHEFRQIIGAILILKRPLSTVSLSRLIGLPLKLIRLRLDLLHSVFSIPDNETSPVRLFHLSFRDFLLNPETREKTAFWVDENEIHYTMTKRCLLVCQSLRRNICGLQSYGTQRADIDHRIIDQSILPELQYACQYWAHHLVQHDHPPWLIYDTLLFLQKHFLHWVETMTLLGLVSEVARAVSLLQKLPHCGENLTLLDFLHDARRFLLKNTQIVDDAPLQLYCSGILFAPRTSIVREIFKDQIPHFIYRLPYVEEKWSATLQTLEGHSGCVLSVAFSPDDRVLASGSDDRIIRIWDSVTGDLKKILVGHCSSIYSMAFSPNGRLLASASHDKTVRLWDISTSKLYLILKGHWGSVNSVAFSPDGQVLASGSDDETIQLWESATGTPEKTLHGHSGLICTVAFSPDGLLLASASDDETIRFWNTRTGALLQTLETHYGSIYSVAFSPDGLRLASASDCKRICIWDTNTGALQQTLDGHQKPIQSVVFSPDGGLLASSSNDMTIRLWDPYTGALQQTLEGHLNWIWSVAFTSDSKILASGSKDKTIRLWDIGTHALRQTLGGHSSSIESLKFSPDGQILQSCSNGDKAICLWSVISGIPQPALLSHSGSICSVAFSLDSQMLASASDDKLVRLWNARTGKLQRTLTGHLESVQSVAFSPDGRLLASGSRDKTARIWETMTGRLKKTIQGHRDSVQSVVFSPNGQLLVSGSYDNLIRLWDTRTGALHQTLTDHRGCLRSLEFSPDGRLLISTFVDEMVQLWEIATGILKHTLRADGLALGFDFPEICSFPEIFLRDLNIQHRGGLFQHIQPQSGLEISILQRQWITLNREKVLWLPPDFRPRSLAIKGNLLALGHASGWVSFIEFGI